MPIDLSSGFKDVKDKINAYKTYREVSNSIKEAKNKQSDFLFQETKNITSSLDNLKKFQDKTFRNTPTSFDQILSLIGITKGSGNEIVSYLKKKLVEASVKIEPEIKEILRTEILKTLGEGQAQTYEGINKEQISTLSSQSNGILIPIKSIDIFGSLKNNKKAILGQLFYEKQEPSLSNEYSAYGGTKPFPFNKELRNRIENENKSYFTEYGDVYRGKSGQPLFDFSFVKKNNEDYISITLINREGDNKISDFVFDYFDTIKIYDSSDFLAQLLNTLLGSIDVTAKLGYGELRTKNKFSIILQRILGLCFDNREEVDVSGTSKISELDDFDDSLFELTEIDLRTIDDAISNIQNSIIELEDCENVKLPIDAANIVNTILSYKDNIDNATVEEQINKIDDIINSISYNQNWEGIFPDTLALKLSFDTKTIKKIPLTVSSMVLSPKVLLPVFAILKNVEITASENAESILNDSNQVVKNFNDINGQVNNFVNDSMDFVFKFKKFSIEIVSKIGALYLRTLYDILKKDIINLIRPIVSEVFKNKTNKKYQIILKLSNILIAIANLIFDYRKCKSLIDDLQHILNLVNTISLNSGATDPIPSVLLPLTQYLPGFSPERSAINIIEEMQKLGIPTGPLPDGSPNLMLQFTLASQIGADKEESENGKVVGILDPSVPFVIRAKKI
jgi:hypothetical protein